MFCENHHTFFRSASGGPEYLEHSCAFLVSSCSMTGSQGERSGKATGTEARQGGPDEEGPRQKKTRRAAKVMHQRDLAAIQHAVQIFTAVCPRDRWHHVLLLQSSIERETGHTQWRETSARGWTRDTATHCAAVKVPSVRLWSLSMVHRIYVGVWE